MNMNRKSGFLDNLPNDIRGERNKELTNEQVVHWIIERLGRKYKDVFLKVSNDLGYQVITRRTSLDTVQAMWEEENVNVKGQRVVLRYLRVTFGGQCFIPDLKDQAFCTINQLHSFESFISINWKHKR